MDYLRLSLGLLLPWLAGYFWLQWLEQRFGQQTAPGGFARRAGIGLFIGLASLYLVVQASSRLVEQVAFWPLAAVIAALALGGYLLSRRTARTHRRLAQPRATDGPRPAGPRPTGPRPGRPHLGRPHPYALLLLALIALHLGFGLVEVLNLPVFPWDAWIAWTYRAKAWFYSGYLAPFASPGEWLAGSELYTMAAASYPQFPSVVSYWAAVSLGHWSETLVNLPTFLCGLGLGLGIYGLGRGYGLGPLPALLAAYLLLSIPMVGSHLSLAGYADIWMAGFAGLGTLSLLTGLVQRRTLPVALGFVLVAFSTQVKHEGAVWLCLGTGVALLAALNPRQLFALVALLALGAALIALSGTSHIALPGIGTVGLSEGHIYLPGLAPIKLQHYALAAPYRAALFQQGSWNLLAAALAAAALALAFAPAGRERLLLLATLLAIALSQLLIFGYTEQGRWAASYTAINRLPLQMTPVLVFILVVALGKIHPGRWPSALAPGLALLLLAGYGLLELTPENAGRAPPLTVTSDQMRAPIGRAIRESGALRVSGYQNGVAIVSARRGPVDASLYPQLSVDLATDGNRAPAFFWRTADQPGDFRIMDIDDDASVIDLSAHPRWRGTVSEMGIAFYESAATIAEVRSITLSPASTLGKLNALLDAWWSTLPWAQESINWVQIGQAQSRLQPVALLSAWLAAALLAASLLALVPGVGRGAYAALPPAFLIAWLALDVQWLHLREDRQQRSRELARQTDIAYIPLGGDRQMAALAGAVKPALDNPRQRVVIASQDSATSFETLRLKYHLLPANAHPLPPRQVQAKAPPTDPVLLLTRVTKPEQKWLKNWRKQLADRTQLRAATPHGILLAPPPISDQSR